MINRRQLLRNSACCAVVASAPPFLLYSRRANAQTGVVETTVIGVLTSAGMSSAAAGAFFTAGAVGVVAIQIGLQVAQYFESRKQTELLKQQVKLLKQIVSLIQETNKKLDTIITLLSDMEAKFKAETLRQRVAQLYGDATTLETLGTDPGSEDLRANLITLKLVPAVFAFETESPFYADVYFQYGCCAIQGLRSLGTEVSNGIADKVTQKLRSQLTAWVADLDTTIDAKSKKLLPAAKAIEDAAGTTAYAVDGKCGTPDMETMPAKTKTLMELRGPPGAYYWEAAGKPEIVCPATRKVHEPSGASGRYRKGSVPYDRKLPGKLNNQYKALAPLAKEIAICTAQRSAIQQALDSAPFWEALGTRDATTP